MGLKLAKALLARPTEMGSRCLIHAALGDTTGKVHGKYLNNCRVEEESDYALSEEGMNVQERIWVRTSNCCDRGSIITDVAIHG